jgi:hypothetical protein
MTGDSAPKMDVGDPAWEFHRAGYLLDRGIFSDAEARQLRETLISAAVWSGEFSGARQRFADRIVEADESFAGAAVDKRVLAPLTAIFGRVPQLVCSYGHEKPALTGAHTVLHSDVAHLRGVEHATSLLMVKVAIALTPVRLDSGPTLIYPGSHAGEAGDPRLVLMEPGDMLMFHANIRHSATANRSSTARLGIWLVFAQPWIRVFPGHEYSQKFLSDIRLKLTERPELADVFGLADPYATRSG